MKENTPLKRASQPDTRSQQGDLPFYLFGLLKERKKESVAAVFSGTSCHEGKARAVVCLYSTAFPY